MVRNLAGFSPESPSCLIFSDVMPPSPYRFGGPPAPLTFRGATSAKSLSYCYTCTSREVPRRLPEQVRRLQLNSCLLMPWKTLVFMSCKSTPSHSAPFPPRLCLTESYAGNLYPVCSNTTVLTSAPAKHFQLCSRPCQTTCICPAPFRCIRVSTARHPDHLASRDSPNCLLFPWRFLPCSVLRPYLPCC